MSTVATYPAVPGSKVPGPSRSAAASERERAPLLRERVLEVLRDFGPLTADACAQEMGVSILSVRPRFSELLALGRIEDSGERRRNGSGKSATVWRRRETRRQEELGL